MYIGRFVIVGKTAAGDWYLGYRVSSRSFPNRVIKYVDDRAIVLPTADAPPSDNPYIAYNCLRTHGATTIVTNGSHVDPAIDKVSLGYPLRDAMALALLALDYEHDSYNTPRIAASVDLASDVGYLGIVADDQLSVRAIPVQSGEAYLIATYELTQPTPISLVGNTCETLCDSIFEYQYEHPVASLAAIHTTSGLQVAARSARD